MTDGNLPLTFAQRQGFAELPAQLRLNELSPHLKAAVWEVVHSSITVTSQEYDHGYGRHLRHGWTSVLKDYWVNHIFAAADEFSNDLDKVVPFLKLVVLGADFQLFWNFVQHVIEHPGCPQSLGNDLNAALTRARAAYRIVDKIVVPISSHEQGESIAAALSIARNADAEGSFSHLKRASSYLTAGNWAASVRESISAVEGAAKAIEPNADTLGKALSKLKSSMGLNEAMSAAFKQLYGYTSDLKGIRHAQVFEGQPNVSERDALFMFGACASFVGYLLSADLSAK